MIEKRTLRGWFEYLDDPKREFTLSEFIGAMVFNQREYARMMFEDIHEMRGASEHTEGMLGAIDLFAMQIAERSGIPYAASATIRTALDKQRDADRQLARREAS